MKAAQPVMPADFWKTASGPVKTVVEVTVAADGSVKRAVIWKSSGYGAADAEALAAVHLNIYSPTVVHCKKVDADYLWTSTVTPP
jgi:TonB family protein